MPGISVNRETLFKKIGKSYSDKEFDTLCFEFGIELDDVETDANGVVTYKIDIPANRYDLLCVEGLGRALKIFTGGCTSVEYKSVPGSETLYVQKETASIRPICVAAILRNVTFTQESYESFIYLQEKLHQNVCRKRTLVAIGTHDLDTIKGPFKYRALPPKDIKFIPLKKTVEMNGEELMKHYETDLSLRSYLPIIRDSPRYPVIYDSKDVVLSLPPIINGEHSKITLNTKNIFIECTATDMTKANLVLDIMVTMFSEYCKRPFEVEQVKIVYEDGSRPEMMTPLLSTQTRSEKLSEITRLSGISMKADKVAELLTRMSLEAKVIDEENLSVHVPATRSDILHTCDLMEDFAIAYGYNNIPRRVPPTNTVAKPQPLNKLTDLLRMELAQCGFTEAMTLTLCSIDENFNFMRCPEKLKDAVQLSNPKTIEYQVVRTSLLPGLLKSVCSNAKAALPVKFFEVADVVYKSKATGDRDVDARNERRLAAIYSSTTSGFEAIHGLLNRIMQVLDVEFIFEGAEMQSQGYHLVESKDSHLFPARCADIIYKGQKIGSFGVVHPEVLESFEIPNICSVLEMSIEPFI